MDIWSLRRMLRALSRLAVRAPLLHSLANFSLVWLEYRHGSEPQHAYAIRWRRGPPGYPPQWWDGALWTYDRDHALLLPDAAAAVAYAAARWPVGAASVVQLPRPP